MFENRSELGWLLLKKALHLCVSIVLGPIQGVSTLLRVTVGIPCHIQPSCVDTPSRILKSNCVYLQCLTIRFQIEKQKKKFHFLCKNIENWPPCVCVFTGCRMTVSLLSNHGFSSLLSALFFHYVPGFCIT